MEKILNIPLIVIHLEGEKQMGKRLYLVRALCPEPFYYSPQETEFFYVVARDEEEAKRRVSMENRLCIPIDATEAKSTF